MLNDERSINMVDEMLGIIPGQTRSYVSSATGSISMGGTPLCPQQLPIHTANSITGITAGALSAAATTILNANTGTGLNTTADSTTFTKSTGTLAAGDAVYATVGGATTYIGTVLTVSPAFTFVNYPTNVVTSSAYSFIPAASKGTVAYTYNVTMPTTTITSNNVSYTIQAGDDYEQEVMKYGKCMGFSVSGGSGGAIDMNAQYMGQAVQLGYVGQGTITATTTSTTVNGVGTVFINTAVSSDIGRKLYTLDNVLIGTIASVTNANTVVLTANALTAVTFGGYRLGGFTKNTEVAAPVDDLIFARTRLFIDNVQPWPVARPTVVQYQFLAFSTSLQCSWTPKFTGEGYQGIDPTWSFALFTNYQVGGDFTVEHDTIASAKYSASSVESLKYAWRNRVPKIVQIDCPSSTAIKWFTPNANTYRGQTLSYTLPTAVNAGTISIDAANPLTVVGTGTSFATPADVGKGLCVKVNGLYYFVGKISTVDVANQLYTLDATVGNLYGVVPAGTSFAHDATKITGGATSFTLLTDDGKDLFKDATTWIGRIAWTSATTAVHTYVSSAIGSFSLNAFTPNATTISSAYNSATGTQTITSAVSAFATPADLGKQIWALIGNEYINVGVITTFTTTSIVEIANALYTVAIPALTNFVLGNPLAITNGTGTIAVSGTTVTGTGTGFATPGDVGKQLWAYIGSSYVYIGTIATVNAGTQVATLVSNVYGTVAASTNYVFNYTTNGFKIENATQPYFPVAGKGPLETYTGVSFRFPVQIMSVSSINDQDGNDIVTVSWQMRYDTTVGDTGGDVRIVNQLPSLSIAS